MKSGKAGKRDGAKKREFTPESGTVDTYDIFCIAMASMMSTLFPFREFSSSAVILFSGGVFQQLHRQPVGRVFLQICLSGLSFSVNCLPYCFAGHTLYFVFICVEHI